MLQKYTLYPELVEFEGESLRKLQCRTMPVMWNVYHNGTYIGMVFARVHRNTGYKDWCGSLNGYIFGPYDYEADAVRKLWKLEGDGIVAKKMV